MILLLLWLIFCAIAFPGFGRGLLALIGSLILGTLLLGAVAIGVGAISQSHPPHPSTPEQIEHAQRTDRPWRDESGVLHQNYHSQPPGWQPPAPPEPPEHLLPPVQYHRDVILTG